MWPGSPGKTVFPQSWDANKIMNSVSEVVTNPNFEWIEGRIIKGVQRYEVIGIVDDVKITVLLCFFLLLYFLTHSFLCCKQVPLIHRRLHIVHQ
jgi:hypothetical protein